MSAGHMGVRLAGSGLRYSQPSSLLQLLQSEAALVTLVAGLLLAVYLYVNRQVHSCRHSTVQQWRPRGVTAPTAAVQVDDTTHAGVILVRC